MTRETKRAAVVVLALLLALAATCQATAIVVDRSRNANENINPQETESIVRKPTMRPGLANPSPPADVFSEPGTEVVRMMDDLAYSFEWNENTGFFEDPHHHVGVSFGIVTKGQRPDGDVQNAVVAIAPGLADSDIQYDLARVFFEDLGLPGEDLFRWYSANSTRVATNQKIVETVGAYSYGATQMNNQVYTLSIGTE